MLYERRLILVAFQVPSLLERLKLNDRARNPRMPVVRYKKMGSQQPFTYTGSGFSEDRFDLKNPGPSELSVVDVCNPLIYWMQTWPEGGAYGFCFENLLSLFSIFADDAPAVKGESFHWNDHSRILWLSMHFSHLEIKSSSKPRSRCGAAKF